MKKAKNGKKVGNYLNFGNAVREKRIASKMTQDQLASACGVSTPRVHQIESGFVTLYADASQKIVRHFGMTEFYRVPEERPKTVRKAKPKAKTKTKPKAKAKKAQPKMTKVRGKDRKPRKLSSRKVPLMGRYRKMAIAVTEARLARGITQKALGEICGTSKWTVSNVESGLASPNAESSQKLVRELGLTEWYRDPKVRAKKATHSRVIDTTQDQPGDNPEQEKIDAEIEQRLNALSGKDMFSNAPQHGTDQVYVPPIEERWLCQYLDTVEMLLRAIHRKRVLAANQEELPF